MNSVLYIRRRRSMDLKGEQPWNSQLQGVHSTQLTWKCLCWKHMGHVLLGPLYWESML